MANTIDIWPAVSPLSRNTVADGLAIQRSTIQPLTDRTDALRSKLDEIGDGNIPALMEELDNEKNARIDGDNDLGERIDTLAGEIVSYVPGSGVDFVQQESNKVAISVKDAKYGIFGNSSSNYVSFDNGGWTFVRKTGSLTISQDGKSVVGLKPGKVYHVTCEGCYKVGSSSSTVFTAYIQDNDNTKHYFDVDMSNSTSREVPVTVTFDYLAEVSSGDDYVFLFSKWGSDAGQSYNVSFEIKSLSLHEIASATANGGDSPVPPTPVSGPTIKAYGLKGTSSTWISSDGKIKFSNTQLTDNTITFVDSSRTEIVLNSSAVYKCDAIIKFKPKNAVPDAYQNVTVKLPYKGTGTSSNCFELTYTVDMSSTDYEISIPLSWQLSNATKLFVNIAGLNGDIYVYTVSLQLIEIIS